MKPNWVEYGLEAFGLGLFMISASAFGVALFHPASPAVAAIPHPLGRSALMGLAMGGTAILNTYSPWGRRSGAHLNPAVTLTFYTLGKVTPTDLAGYVAGQFVGGLLGMLVAGAVLSPWISHPAVNYVVTVPGPIGLAAAFGGEAVIAFILMTVVLACAARPATAPYTGLAAAALIALYVTFEAPPFGHEHESGPDAGIGAPGQVVDGTLDLLHRATPRHVGRRRAPPPPARPPLRQAASRRPVSLHFLRELTLGPLRSLVSETDRHAARDDERHQPMPYTQ